jgi:hypothetical protein
MCLRVSRMSQKLRGRRLEKHPDAEALLAYLVGDERVRSALPCDRFAGRQRPKRCCKSGGSPRTDSTLDRADIICPKAHSAAFVTT